jgi:hypothetical protein
VQRVALLGRAVGIGVAAGGLALGRRREQAAADRRRRPGRLLRAREHDLGERAGEAARRHHLHRALRFVEHLRELAHAQRRLAPQAQAALARRLAALAVTREVQPQQRPRLRHRLLHRCEGVAAGRRGDRRGLRRPVRRRPPAARREQLGERRQQRVSARLGVLDLHPVTAGSAGEQQGTTCPEDLLRQQQVLLDRHLIELGRRPAADRQPAQRLGQP